jgi:hypothetical protein
MDLRATLRTTADLRILLLRNMSDAHLEEGAYDPNMYNVIRNYNPNLPNGHQFILH